jgi:uncharacterized membrane protein/AraC-like DNA-binding protein
LVIRWFRSIATTFAADDSAGSGSGFGTERNPARLVFFSDAVFAIAVTLLVLEIRPPQDTRHLLHGLAALWPSYLAYAITFLLIGQVWANHHVMFDHIRSADRMVLFLNTLLLMDIAFLPFAAAVLSSAFRTGHGQRTAVVFHGMAFELAAILFNVIWDYVRHDQRLLGTTIDSAGARAISRRFRLALAWIGTGTLLGALLPVLGMAVIAAFVPTTGCRSGARAPAPSLGATTVVRRDAAGGGGLNVFNHRWRGVPRLPAGVGARQPGLHPAAELVLIEVLRLHLATAPAADRGWIAALGDPVLAPALSLMHGAPGRRWTVADLAAGAAVSRWLLDERFRQVLGRSPIRYLTEWRMHLAEKLLATTQLGVATVARRVGYDSEEAFSRAFKRPRGCRRVTGGRDEQ